MSLETLDWSKRRLNIHDKLSVYKKERNQNISQTPWGIHFPGPVLISRVKKKIQALLKLRDPWTAFYGHRLDCATHEAIWCKPSDKDKPISWFINEKSLTTHDNNVRRRQENVLFVIDQRAYLSYVWTWIRLSHLKVSLMPLSRNIYSQVLQRNERGEDESSEKLLGGESVDLQAQPIRQTGRFSFWAPHLALFSLYTILYVALYTVFIGGPSHKLKETCLRQTSLHCKWYTDFLCLF